MGYASASVRQMAAHFRCAPLTVVFSVSWTWRSPFQAPGLPSLRHRQAPQSSRPSGLRSAEPLRRPRKLSLPLGFQIVVVQDTAAIDSGQSDSVFRIRPRAQPGSAGFAAATDFAYSTAAAFDCIVNRCRRGSTTPQEPPSTGTTWTMLPLIAPLLMSTLYFTRVAKRVNGESQIRNWMSGPADGRTADKLYSIQQNSGVRL